MLSARIIMDDAMVIPIHLEQWVVIVHPPQ